MSSLDAEAANTRLHVATVLAGVGGAVLVVEAIVEDIDVKRTLFAELETIVADGCILATSTSSISVTASGAKLRRPQRLVGMHFFNPVPLMALVEVVKGLATEEPVADTVFATATASAWGKSPVHARSPPGFIVNRVARPFYGEALRLLSEQACDPATLDAVMVDAGGFRMGPFALMDLIGHDVKPAPRTEAARPRPETVSLSSGPDGVSPVNGARIDGLIDALRQRLAGAGFVVGRSAGLGAFEHEAPTFHCNGAAIFLTGGRSATGRADADHHADTVLFDLALDYAGATRIALSRADQCGDAAHNAAVGLFQAAGFAVSRIDDVSGMVVMRTVAMLANEAADAVNQGVCSASAVDIAMQKGVNYPRGPLAWTDTIGVRQVVTVLSKLAPRF